LADIQALIDKTGPKLSLELSKKVYAHADNELKEKAAEHKDLERQYNAKAAECEREKRRVLQCKEEALAAAIIEVSNGPQ
jgi:molecular chaperone GrpE (heat shock protein)